MKNTTWVFGSMLAAGCMLLSVPASAQGGLPQGGFPQGGFPQGGFPQQGAGRNPAMPAGATAGKANQAGAKAGTAKTNTTTTKNTTAKSDKAVLEAAKYQLSNHRTDLIKSIIDGYASSDDLSDSAVVRSITEDIQTKMPLIPSVPFEKVDLQALNKKAKDLVEQEYGVDDKKFASLMESEAAAEFPLYKVGDSVVVNYNMGPKHFSVKGKLYRVTENAITVEDKVINLIDLNDETRSRFDPQKNKYMRARYIETHMHLINRIRLEKLNDYYEKLKGEIFSRNETAGYIYDSQTDHWSTAQEIAKNYIDRLVKEKSKQQRPKPATGRTDDAASSDDEVWESVSDTGTAAAAQDTDAQVSVSPANRSIKIEDNEYSQKKYKSVLEKAEKLKNDANENYAGIDADSGYKNACWGFTNEDTRYALWHEPEFPFIEPAIGRDVIKFTDDLEADIAGSPSTIDLVYVSNSLSKVVYTMKDCSKQDFLSFKDALTEQYGRAVEDKGTNSAAFENIFSGKTKPQQIADASAVAEAQAAVKDAEKAFNKAVAELKNADDDNREALQEARDQAASALKEANAKAEAFENTVSSDNLPYVYSRIKLAKDGEGNVLLPYTFTWKGEKVSGTLIFYYDKARNKVTNCIFAKEYK